MIKGILLDLDGTLLNSLDVWEKVDERFLKRRNIEVTNDYSEALLTMRFEEAAKYTIARYHLDESVEQVMAEWMRDAKQSYLNEVTLKQGVMTFIKSLKKLGYTLAILTSCHQMLFEPCLRQFQLWDDFDFIFESNVLNMSKSKKDIYLHALHTMQLNADECVFIDDVVASLKAAKEAGISVIGMKDEKSYCDEMPLVTNAIISNFDTIEI